MALDLIGQVVLEITIFVMTAKITELERQLEDASKEPELSKTTWYLHFSRPLVEC